MVWGSSNLLTWYWRYRSMGGACSIAGGWAQTRQWSQTRPAVGVFVATYLLLQEERVWAGGGKRASLTSERTWWTVTVTDFMGSTLEDSLMFCVDAVGSAHTAPAAHQSLTVILRGRIVLFELLGELSHLFFFFLETPFLLKNECRELVSLGKSNWQVLAAWIFKWKF